MVAQDMLSTTAPAAAATLPQSAKTQPAMPASSSRYARLVRGQSIHMVDSFTLESGIALQHVPVAYKTWGSLDATASNVVVICHALSGSADLEDWWGPLLGPGKPFDTSRFFIFCGNVLGSPYGTASPCTIDPATSALYGPTFPLTTIRDDVRLHRLVLDALGVKQVAFAIGGSMGGMQVLEWGMLGPQYVRHLVPIATSGRHSAWCISWGEAQRQAIYSDPKYCDGYYAESDPPNAGLAAARMSALLTYRTRNSFESRFGRKVVPIVSVQSTVSNAELQHNEGHKVRLHGATKATTATTTTTTTTVVNGANGVAQEGNADQSAKADNMPVYSAQSYLRYQGDKFVGRFDANCYIAITRKLDTHDISAGRGDMATACQLLTQRALVIGIETDGLFTVEDQYELGSLMPNASVIIVKSGEGHDGFLLEFDQMRGLLQTFIRECAPEYFDGDASAAAADATPDAPYNSLFGEAEDLLQW
ncbi:Alpha/Beta hydrolase protein [Entophlyctis helioformis]|nr:Alpha/Beta hydrolase protein [Entophlyctis helioformis]